MEKYADRASAVGIEYAGGGASRRVRLGTFSYSWLTFLLPRRCIMVNLEPASKLDAVGDYLVLRCLRVRSGVGAHARSGWAGDLAASCARLDRDFRRDAS